MIEYVSPGPHGLLANVLAGRGRTSSKLADRVELLGVRDDLDRTGPSARRGTAA